MAASLYRQPGIRALVFTGERMQNPRAGAPAQRKNDPEVGDCLFQEFLRSPVVPFSLLLVQGSLIKQPTPKKGALMIVWLLGYREGVPFVQACNAGMGIRHASEHYTEMGLWLPFSVATGI